MYFLSGLVLSNVFATKKVCGNLSEEYVRLQKKIQQLQSVCENLLEKLSEFWNFFLSNVQIERCRKKELIIESICFILEHLVVGKLFQVAVDVKVRRN